MGDGERAPLDPELATIAADLRQLPSPFELPIAATRARMEAAAAARPPVQGIAGWDDLIADAEEISVPIRRYRPQHPTGVVALFFHGGGFAFGGPASTDPIARRLCRTTGAIILAVDYRLAPEHPFPAAHDDALAATLWASRLLGTLGGDGRLAVIGESAGANLAAAAALACRDHGVTLAAQLLISPGLDLARDVNRLDSLGREFPLLSVRDLRAISRLYLGDRADAAARCPPSPLRAKDLKGVAPAILAIAGHDPLEEEGLAYARRLMEAGVATEVLRLPTMFHPFLGFVGESAGAEEAYLAICRSFASVLDTTGSQHA